MANPTSTLNVQVVTSANLSGLQQVQQAFFNLKNAFEVAGAEEALNGVLNVVQKIGDAVMETVNKAAQLQSEAFPLRAMIGDAEKANAVITQMEQVWQEFGVVSNEALANTVRMLILTHTHVDNLIPRMMEMAQIHIATGVSVEALVGSYAKMKMAIENVTAPATRGMGELMQGTVTLMNLLEDHFTKLEGHTVTEAELLTRFKAGKVSIDDLNKALRESVEAGGRFEHSIEGFQLTWNGAVTAMKTAWQGFEVEIGKPIIAFATPYINEITRIEKALAKIAEEKGWQVALLAAWTIVIDKMAEVSATVLTEIFLKLGPALADALWLGFLERTKQTLNFQQLRDLFSGNFGKALQESLSAFDWETVLKKVTENLLKNTKISAEQARKLLEETLAQIKMPPILPPESVENTERVNQGLKQIEASLKADEAVLEHIKTTQEIISRNPFISADEKTRATIATIRADLLAINKEVADLQAKKSFLSDPAKIAEVDAQIAKMRDQFRLVFAQLQVATRPLQAELGRWAQSFGDTMTQVAKTIEDTVGVALQGLNQWIVTGKFNLQSMMQSIEMLGLKLIEQLIIQQVMGKINATAAAAQAAITGPLVASAWAPAATLVTIATEGQSAAGAPEEVLAAILAVQGFSAIAHEGGTISDKMKRFHNGGLAPDEVPIIAQEGEIMIQRSVAERFGDFLLALNAGVIGHSGGLLSFGSGGRIHFAPGSGGGDIWAGGHGMLGSPGGAGDYPGGGYGEYVPGPYAGLPILRATRVGGSTAGGGGVTSSGGIPSTFPVWTPSGPSGPVGPSMGHIGGGYFAGGGYTGWVGGSYGAFAAAVASALAASGIMGGSAQSHIGFGGISHRGGAIGRLRLRLHNGGPVPSDIGMGGGDKVGISFGSPGAGTSGGLMSGGGVHVYAFTDLKALTKHMASRDGQKIIFDTVKGNRINLGMR